MSSKTFCFISLGSLLLVLAGCGAQYDQPSRPTVAPPEVVTKPGAGKGSGGIQGLNAWNAKAGPGALKERFGTKLHD